MENLLNLLKLRNRLRLNGPIIEAVFYRMPENADEESLFVENWRRIVDHVHPVNPISKQFSENEGARLPVRTSTCPNIWERMTVYWNGDVTMCIADLNGNIILGNLMEESIQQIWNCDDLLFIKERHKESNFLELPLCSSCDW